MKDSDNTLITFPKYVEDFFIEIGKYGKLLWWSLLSLTDFSTYYENTLKRMKFIGIQSLPIVFLTAAFMGMVESVQVLYSLEDRAPYYLVGSVVVESIILELGPVLTALILAGRIGASIAAELGTMRVTEQIDALEVMAFNPVAYLVVPTLIAGVIMVPVLTMFANVVGCISGWIMSIITVDLTTTEFLKGARQFFIPWDLTYGLIKSAVFGFFISANAAYVGYFTTGGAEGVGKATTRSVVISCVMILILDYLMAQFLLKVGY